MLNFFYLNPDSTENHLYEYVSTVISHLSSKFKEEPVALQIFDTLIRRLLDNMPSDSNLELASSGLAYFNQSNDVVLLFNEPTIRSMV